MATPAPAPSPPPPGSNGAPPPPPARPCQRCGHPLPPGSHHRTRYHAGCKPAPVPVAKPPAGKREVPCKICGSRFTRRAISDLYCSDECRVQGLLRSIRRQSRRRQQAKEKT